MKRRQTQIVNILAGVRTIVHAINNKSVLAHRNADRPIGGEHTQTRTRFDSISVICFALSNA